MTDIEEWWAAGERLTVPLCGQDRAVFVRRLGSGPSITLLHGFPSCSYDWARIAPALRKRGDHRLLVDERSQLRPLDRIEQRGLYRLRPVEVGIQPAVEQRHGR